MKVADIYALFGIRTDKQSVGRARDELGRFVKQTDTSFKKLAVGVRRNIASMLGGFALVRGTQDAHAFATSLVRLQTASKGAMGSLSEIRDQILGASDETGIAKDQIQQGAAAFVSLTGDAKTAKEQLELFAKVSQATGSGMEDIARSGAALQQSMGISGDSFEKAFSILIASGKAGSVELKDVSQVMAKLSAVSSQFADGQGVNALADLSAGLQLVTRGFGGRASEGANAMSKLMGSMVRAAPKLKKFGVEVFDIDPQTGQKMRRNFQAIVEDMKNSRLSLDPTALQEIVGSKEALAAFEQLTKVQGEWSQLANVTRDANDVAEDYAKVSATAAIKATKAWNRFKNMLTRVFTVVLNILVGVGENIDHILVLIGSLGLAFAILRFEVIKTAAASVAAAIKTGIAWTAANLPLILMAALFVAIGLAIFELIETLRGKDTFLRDLFNSIVKNWGEAIDRFLRETIEKMQQLGRDIKDFLGLGGGPSLIQRARQQVDIQSHQRDFAGQRALNTITSAGGAIARAVLPEVNINITTGADPEEAGVAAKRVLESVGRDLEGMQ